MSHKHRREERDASTSHYDKAKAAIRQAFNKPSNSFPEMKNDFNFRLYDNDRQERINEIIDDADGDVVVERQTDYNNPQKVSRIIEANDRRHDAVIFGDKALEEQQKNQLLNSFKQSSRYATTSLAGPLLLQDPESKRLQWKTKMHGLWSQRCNAQPTTIHADMDTS